MPLSRRDPAVRSPGVSDGLAGQSRADSHEGRLEDNTVRTRWPRSRGQKVIATVVAVVAIWGIAVLVEAVLAYEHVHQGQAEVQAARSKLSANQVLTGAPEADLNQAANSFSAAHSLLSSPLLWPVDVVPVVGRQLRSVQDLSGAAAQVARTGVTAVQQSQSLLRLPHTAGPERVVVLRRLAALAGATHLTLSRVDLGPDQALIGPVAREHDTFANDLAQVQTTLARTSAAASEAADILQGPSNYLLLAANNAEMRSGSGAFLEAGIVTTGNGELHLDGSMVPTSSLTLPLGAVPVAGDLEARWGFLLPGVDWRNLGLTPQFDVNAPLAARMWEADTGQRVDGVLAIDVQSLQEILGVTGPVTTSSGQVVSDSNVVQFLLHDQYVGVSDSNDSSQRVDQLSTLASATLNALENRSYSLRSMVNALSAATQGRNVLLWSADSRAQSVWHDVGIAGELTPSSLMATVINRGGNKLDQYLSVKCSLRLSSNGNVTDGHLTMTMANHTPPGQSQFIAGPYPGLNTSYGEYVGIATVNLPGYVRHVSTSAARSVVTSGPEGPTLLVGTSIDIPAGGTKRVSYDFVLPEAHGTISVVPSARIPPVQWHANGSYFEDNQAHTVSW
jgi:hypothetical protein